MKGNMIVSNRDLALFWNKIGLTDGSIAHVMFSIEHDSIPKTKCVRAEAAINLLILQPVSDTRYLISLSIFGICHVIPKNQNSLNSFPSLN